MIFLILVKVLLLLGFIGLKILVLIMLLLSVVLKLLLEIK